MGGGAWPFLVGGVICLVYSDNERDYSLGLRGLAVAGASDSKDYAGKLQGRMAITGL